MHSICSGMWSIRGDPLRKPKCLNTFVIPDTSIKTSTMITDVAEPLMLSVIYRNIMAAIAAREGAGIPQHHALRVCGWGCKGDVTLWSAKSAERLSFQWECSEKSKLNRGQVELHSYYTEEWISGGPFRGRLKRMAVKVKYLVAG